MTGTRLGAACAHSGDFDAALESQRFLKALRGPGARGLLEVRFRRAGGGMGQCFFESDHLAAASRVIAGLSERTDVYVGVAPRTAASGRRSAVDAAAAVWADCDTADSIARLREVPTPSIIVRSGSAHGRHAYWLLEARLEIAAVEALNRRMALAIGADGRSADGARILRPPGTRNFKLRPPAAVTLERMDPDVRYSPSALATKLPRLAERREPRSRRAPVGSDPLRAIPPATYVRVLLGVDVGRSRKITCPFHDDRTPSLHVYPTADEGWYCFGCGRGTSIYDLAAAAWGLGTRGGDFVRLRDRLLAIFRLERG